jgi:hypothetical protein
MPIKRLRRRNGNGNGWPNSPSKTPRVVLNRKFRYVQDITLNNSSGSGSSGFTYFSKYFTPQPENATGFRDAQRTFEFWRIKKFRCKALPSYNSYNQSYNTINLDALASMQIWTASDFSTNETVSGVSIMSYNNAKVNTLQLNKFTGLVDTQCRINDETNTPHTILPRSTWLDTSTDLSSVNYSGFQLFARMPTVIATNYLPKVQLIFEVEVEFKQPAYQNRPNGFELDFVGSKLLVVPDGSLPDEQREYEVVSYTLNGTGNNVRLERTDGVAGSLDYTQEEFWEVYYYNTSGKYFGDRPANYSGPIPRKPEGWKPGIE